MKHFQKQLLDNQNITWVKPGDSVPFAQGEALNKLNSYYKTKNQALRQGYFNYQPTADMSSYDLPNQPIDLPAACYYLIERKTKLDSGEVVLALIAFQEHGHCIEGVAMFY